VLLTVVDGESPEIPKLRWWDRRTAVNRFNELFEMLKGDVQMHMRWLMFAARMDKVVLRMLEMRSPRDYVPAIEAAGRLRLRPAIGQVTRYVDDSRPEIAMLAAQALPHRPRPRCAACGQRVPAPPGLGNVPYGFGSRRRSFRDKGCSR